jgi:DNA-binding transcriptional regulator YiaG
MDNVLSFEEYLKRKRGQKNSKKFTTVRDLLREVEARAPEAHGLMKSFIVQQSAFQFGYLIFSMRRRAGLTQQQLAKELGVGLRQLAYWESGGAKRGVNFLLLQKAALACRCELHFLITKEGESIPQGRAPQT